MCRSQLQTRRIRVSSERRDGLFCPQGFSNLTDGGNFTGLKPGIDTGISRHELIFFIPCGETAADNNETAFFLFFPLCGKCQMFRNFFPCGTEHRFEGTVDVADLADQHHASFKGGAWYDNHQHYDENSFIIYKKGFLAVDSGTRGRGPHHLVYYPQTVAHNAILIRGFQEPLAEHWYPTNVPPVEKKTALMDGGQNKRTVAKPLPFAVTDQYAITGGDATKCYAPEKCKEAVRQFVYIKPDYFVVYDRVESVKEDQDKVFLLHTIGEPVLKNNAWRSTHGQGALFTRMLLPQDHRTEVIGGEGREYMANGVNYPSPMPEKPDSVCGKYRVEFTAPEDKTARFLTVLQAADQSVTEMVDCKLQQDAEFDTVSFTTREGWDCTISFRRSGKPGGILKITGKGIEPVEKRF